MIILRCTYTVHTHILHSYKMWNFIQMILKMITDQLIFRLLIIFIKTRFILHVHHIPRWGILPIFFWVASLSPGKCDKCVNFKHHFGIVILSVKVHITLEWMPEDPFESKSTLVIALWFGHWLCAVRQQAISDVSQDLWCYMSSCHNKLIQLDIMTISVKQSWRIRINISWIV